jgi:hypothetical protein
MVLIMCHRDHRLVMIICCAVTTKGEREALCKPAQSYLGSSKFPKQYTMTEILHPFTAKIPTMMNRFMHTITAVTSAIITSYRCAQIQELLASHGYTLQPRPPLHPGQYKLVPDNVRPVFSQWMDAYSSTRGPQQGVCAQ